MDLSMATNAELIKELGSRMGANYTETQGLHNKFTVFRNKDGTQVSEQTFILFPGRDFAAWAALREYGLRTHNEKLAADISDWLEALHKIMEVD